jgi:methionine sulfoxide reductase heme-binding subunit
MAAFIALAPSHGGGSSISQWVVATGYVAVALLSFTLLIGPANLLLRRRNPNSSYLRRDVGAWTAVVSIVHVVLGFETHDTGSLSSILDFFVVDGAPLTTSRGLGNWTGLAATVIVVGLLAISTDRSIRELRGTRWKDLQRLNYTLFALVVLHAVFYGALGRATSPLTLLLLFTVTAVLVGQAIGVWVWRRRRAERQQRRIKPEQSSSQAQLS